MLTEETGDLVEFWRRGNAIGITTNGFVKNNGECVMGRGIALSINKAIPGFARELGDRITLYGNVPFWFEEHRIWTFPVKHHWRQEADIELIKESAGCIVGMNRLFWQIDYLDFPRPGCGNGRLSWTNVKKEIKPIFTDVEAHVWDFGAK